ncbi:Glutathione peroxidase 3, partial [Ophiophagus hannah]
VELEGDNVLTQRQRERNTKEHLEQTQISVEARPGRGAEALSLLLSNHEGQTERSLDPFLALGWFISAQPGTGTTGGLQLSHQHEEASSCSYAPNSQPIPDRAKVDCYDSVKGSAHDYGALSLTELNALQNSLKTDRLVILGFPCNQFGKQEPGQNSEILQGIKHVRPGGGFVPNFQLFQKGDVNGENEQKIYTFLKNSCPPVVETFGDTAKLFWSPLKIHDIKWNFEKFLVNPQGKPVMRWFHRTNVSTVKNDIIRFMRKKRSG